MMMYDDFIRRVHKHRTNPNLSRQIKKCVDYIDESGQKMAENLFAALVELHRILLPHPTNSKEETGLSVC